MANDDLTQAIAFLEADQWVDAEAACRRALARSPYSIQATNCLGVALGHLGRYEEAVAVLQPLADHRPDIVGVSLNFGIALRGARIFAEAERWLRKAIEIEPDNPAGYVNLGAVLTDLGRNGEAIEVFRKAVALDPMRAEAHHMIAALEGTTPDAPSLDYVRSLFNDYATRFESDLVGALGYRIPQALREIVGDGPFMRALDLGCGTGLVGMAFANCVNQIVGVDVADRMIAEAATKKIYASLHAMEFSEYFASEDAQRAPFDLVLAADVFIYVGKLDSLFEDVHTHLTPMGRFAFSVEQCSGDGFALQPSGRYAHSSSYIERLAQTHDMRIVARDTVSIRKHRDGEADGLVFVLQGAS